MNGPALQSAGTWQVGTALLWAAIVAAAYAAMLRRDSRPGAPPQPPEERLRTGAASVATGRLLLMFAHPRCPCTRASLRELNQILSFEHRFDRVEIVFFCPRGAGADWTDTDLVRQAQALPGVAVAWDEEGELAQRYGARTSGHVLVYGPAGQLEFSGGITGMRGHEGWNEGRAAVERLGQCLKPDVASTPVFGCPLWESILAP